MSVFAHNLSVLPEARFLRYGASPESADFSPEILLYEYVLLKIIPVNVVDLKTPLTWLYYKKPAKKINVTIVYNLPDIEILPSLCYDITHLTTLHSKMLLRYRCFLKCKTNLHEAKTIHIDFTKAM